MNKIILSSFAALCLLCSCSKSKDRNATVLRECSGVFLTINGKDYNVCNSDKLKRYKAGDRVNVTYNHIGECANPDYEAPMCFVGHASEGWIELTSVK